MPKVRVDWLMVLVAEVVIGQLKPLKPTVLLPVVAICAALERGWPTGLAAAEVCRV
jgi:hypothetical protein